MEDPPCSFSWKVVIAGFPELEQSLSSRFNYRFELKGKIYNKNDLGPLLRSTTSDASQLIQIK